LKVQYQNNEAQDTNKYKKKIPPGILAVWAEKNHGNLKLEFLQVKPERLAHIIGDQEYSLLLALLS
jgi:hypothetical protein